MPLAKYYGKFRKQISLFQAVALIVSATIGAGVLVLPFAVSKVGLLVGMIYIVCLGLVVMCLNLLVGEVTARTTGEMQLVGLARKYLGKFGGIAMSVMIFLMAFGVLVVYMIGEGEMLAGFFGGDKFWWSILFFVVGMFLVWLGMNTIKTIDFFLSLGILGIILAIALFSAPHISFPNFAYTNFAYLFLPYGVILFAFSSASSIPEAHSILKNRDADFKKVIMIASLITIISYALFTLVVVGVTGAETTEIATVGLGLKVGRAMEIFGSLFAFFAMGANFLMVGISLKDSFAWDYKWSSFKSTAIIFIIPLVVFLLGMRKFLATIDIVGGVFASIEMLLLVLIYWRAKYLGDLKKSKYNLHHAWLFVALLFVVLTIGAIYNVVKVF